MTAPEFPIELHQHGEVTVIKPIGRVTAEGNAVLEEKLGELLDRGRVLLVVDFSASHFVSSTELGTFLYYQRRLEEKGGCLLLAAPGRATRIALNMSNLDRVLTVCGTVDEAVELARQKTGSGRWQRVEA